MKIWLVNTNSNADNGNPNGFKFMLRQNRVSAFYDRKDTIDKIMVGDLVLLYHNQNRIIAAGFALGNMLHDFEEVKSIEHSVDVNWIWKAVFDENYNPVNFIDRNDLSITTVMSTVNNVTSQVNGTKLLELIGQRQRFL
ncbi:hypothetical protein SAMN05421780_10324 [Flexibacter flexilis DSM 6793]|uniref:EVE domain-containing protein n=1 Tax=Flexibacter flexilis DSM 6793 TaxID=927664 RepID=A0A1I1GMD3_9BACT|nr:hypothetical protein [Flexibacter flexilis]SFC12917.1 hypothetical protein SAMN05421780_10324 [Flexibacter flexilis DSM 6793]